jgi:hypothetical protein
VRLVAVPQILVLQIDGGKGDGCAFPVSGQQKSALAFEVSFLQAAGEERVELPAGTFKAGEIVFKLGQKVLV